MDVCQRTSATVPCTDFEGNTNMKRIAIQVNSNTPMPPNNNQFGFFLSVPFCVAAAFTCPNSACGATARGKGEPHLAQVRSVPGFSVPQFVQVTTFGGGAGARDTPSP